MGSIRQSEKPNTPPGLPSYTAEHAPDDDQKTLLDRLGSAMAEERGVSASVDAAAEVERLRNFLLFCICIDYRCRPDLALSAADKQHFIEMSEHLDTLAASNTKMSYLYRAEIARYFWLFLHEPCIALKVSVECAAVTVSRFSKYHNIFGRYKGSSHGVLHNNGLEALAQKLWTDYNIILPRLGVAAEWVVHMRRQIANFARQFFVRLNGVTELIVGARDYAQISSDDYTASERGKAYDKDRRKALTVVERCRAKPGIIREQARIRLEGLRSQPDVFPVRRVQLQSHLQKVHWDDRRLTIVEGLDLSANVVAFEELSACGLVRAAAEWAAM
ncbi:hypothetical protein LTR95_014088 [Oleoguttula sp. CCFEE 5521]